MGKALLLFSLLVGLTLTSAMGRAYEVVCDSADSCGEPTMKLAEHDHPCDDCPPPPPCPCDHPVEDEPTPQEDDTCPSPDHSHHHHHHCLSTAATAWMITGGEPFALHPPFPGEARPLVDFLFVPESPASVLDRPPIS